MDWKKYIPIHKRYSRLIPIGLIYFVFILWNDIPYLWTSDKDLIPITGTLSSANFYVRTEYVKHRYSTDEVRLTDLIFYLSEFDKKFIVTHKIDRDQSFDKELSSIQRKLNAAQKISVYIKKSDSNEYSPKIYSISADGYTLISLTSEKENTKTSTLISLVLCFSFIIGPIVYYRVFDKKQ